LGAYEDLAQTFFWSYCVHGKHCFRFLSSCQELDKLLPFLFYLLGTGLFLIQEGIYTNRTVT
jgi:hypothetical protein